MLIPISDGDYPSHYGVETSLTYIWDVPTLSWVKNTGAGGGGGAVTIADGADVAEGATTDAAVITNTTGTVSGKLRGLVKWAYERMPAALGQTTMAASLPVVVASNQSAVPVTGNKTNNAAAPGATNVGVLGGFAWEGVTPTYTEGNLVAFSTDLAGAVRTNGTVSNAAGAFAVNIQDGGNSITVDGTVTTSPPANASTNVAQFGASAVVTGTGAGGAGIPRVTVSNDSALATVTTVTAVTAITNALPTGANIIGSVNGDIDHDVANTLKQIQVSGNANPTDVPPTAVSANGDRVRAWYDRYGSPVIRSRKIRESYTAVFRLAEAAGRLDQTFTHTANTNKQWATLHHTAGATKEVRLQKCVVWVTAMTAVAPQGIIELRQISAAPATGNPAITPTPRRRGGTAAEAVCLYLPTTAGTEAGVNTPLAHHVFDDAVSVATAAWQHPQTYETGGIVLYNASTEDDEVMPPVLPVATLDGWAVVSRLVGATVMRATVMMVFTEEIP